MSIVDAINRLDAAAKAVESYKKWHPQPPQPLTCPFCDTKFQDRLRVLELPDGRSRPVLMKAAVLLGIHATAYTYGTHFGMCGWSKAERTKLMAKAPALP